MSVSDPMLKRLKHHVLDLRMAQENNECSEVDDSHPKLQPLCEVLEDIFRRGLRKSYFSLKKNSNSDYWNVFETLPSICDNGKQRKQGMGFNPYFPLNPVFNLCLEDVKQNNRTVTSQGKGRLMLRYLLQKRLIVWPIDALKSLGCIHEFYDDLYSIIGNEILREILLSLLMELVNVKMGNFCLKNANFLDNSWALPIYKQLEFVPCKLLGLDLIYIDGYQVVNGVLDGSVAEENNDLERGDILDELYGVALRNTRMLLRDIMKSHSGEPVSIGVVKIRLSDGSLYSPLIRLLQQSSAAIKQHFQWKPPTDNEDDELLNLNDATPSTDQLPIHARLDSDFPDDVPAQNPDMYPSYIVKYVGKTETGTDGSVAQIENAVARVLAKHNDPKDYQLVQLILGEKDVSVVRCSSPHEASIDNGEIILQPSYPMISSCGRRVDCQRFFAYIAGESTCTISRHFVCFVFQARNEIQARTILCAIAQGFERTHWAL